MKQKRVLVTIKTEYITLGQFLKFTNLIDSGSKAKIYLATQEVTVNNELESRRGRKLRPGDVVVTEEATYEIVSQ